MATHKTLIFHIGDHKTGSTSIQHAFARKGVILEGRTILYPGSIAHNWLKRPLKAYSRGKKKAPAYNAAIKKFKNLAENIRASKADFCLISAEGIQDIKPAVFHEVVTKYFADAADEIRVIAYVRPHGPRVMSSFAERLKIGALSVMDTGPEQILELFAEKRIFPYHARFGAWRAEFGDNFLLRPMIRSQLYNGSVVEDFVHHAFSTTDFQLVNIDSANESLDLVDLMRLKHLQSQCRERSGDLRHALGWEFGRVVAAMPSPEVRTKLLLHKGLARKIHTAWLEDARAVDQAFFGGAPLLEDELDAALEGAVETKQSFQPEDWLGADELRGLTVLSHIISDMAANQAVDWPTHWRTKLVSVLRPQEG